MRKNFRRLVYPITPRLDYNISFYKVIIIINKKLFHPFQKPLDIFSDSPSRHRAVRDFVPFPLNASVYRLGDIYLTDIACSCIDIHLSIVDIMLGNNQDRLFPASDNIIDFSLECESLPEIDILVLVLDFAENPCLIFILNLHVAVRRRDGIENEISEGYKLLCPRPVLKNRDCHVKTPESLEPVPRMREQNCGFPAG